MPEVYHVIIRGGTPNPNQLTGDGSEGTFRVDWQSVLPKKFKKFAMSSHFFTINGTFASSTSSVFVECSAFSSIGMFDNLRNMSSKVICVARQYTSGATYYESSKPFNLTVTYPTENQFEIKLTNELGVKLPPAEFTGWVLDLEFVGLD